VKEDLRRRLQVSVKISTVTAQYRQIHRIQIPYGALPKRGRGNSNEKPAGALVANQGLVNLFVEMGSFRRGCRTSPKTMLSRRLMTPDSGST